MLETDAEPMVLRRPPLGHVMETAHDMRREHRVQSALHALGLPVPPMLALVTDEQGAAGVGTAFYLMGYVDGEVLSTTADNTGWTDEAFREAGRSLARFLATLHDVDIDLAGLADYGRPTGYLERQLRRWSRQLLATTSRELPALHSLAERLAPAPETGGTAVVHGDFKINNAILEPGTGRLCAVVDWEMSTLGDPLADLALFGLYWQLPTLSPVLREVFESPVDGRYPSFDEVLRIYCEQRGIGPPSMSWHVAFAAYKLAVIVESLHFRFITGGTVGTGFERFGEMTPILASVGHEVLDGGRQIFGE